MEMELKNIINKIKEEGVGEAEKEAGNILNQAKEKAADIVTQANKSREETIKLAEKEAQKLKSNAREAIKQASRDVLLGLREDIILLFEKVLKQEIKTALPPEALKDIIIHLAEKFKESGQVQIEVLLSKKDKLELEKLSLSKLKTQAAKGIVLKASDKVESGFRIGEEGGNAYYDFTDEAIKEAFKAFLNPRIAEILDSTKK